MGVPEPISIHAPLAGCDLRSAHQDSGTSYFNPRTPYGVRRRLPQPSVSIVFISIHAPLTGCDLVKSISRFARNTFQSTHPLRGATLSSPSPALPAIHFNPRTPCGVRPALMLGMGVYFCISIHAPLAGCDCPTRARKGATNEFQSAHPLRGATAGAELLAVPGLISIHAPLAGCDFVSGGVLTVLGIFQSTHPLRGAMAPHPADH